MKKVRITYATTHESTGLSINPEVYTTDEQIEQVVRNHLYDHFAYTYRGKHNYPTLISWELID